MAGGVAIYVLPPSWRCLGVRALRILPAAFGLVASIHGRRRASARVAASAVVPA